MLPPEDFLDIEPEFFARLSPNLQAEGDDGKYLGIPEELYEGHPHHECSVTIDADGAWRVTWQPPGKRRARRRARENSSALRLCDLKALLERPFFALSKTRHTPIRYVSPDTRIFVNVDATSSGLATIWDADVLIYLISALRARQKRGDEASASLQVRARDLLTALGRGTGGRHYDLLRMALTRLQDSRVETNVRAGGQPGPAVAFRFIEAWTEDAESGDGRAALTITLPNWIVEAMADGGNFLPIAPAYLRLTGGRARWLYRVARKHAGGNGSAGWSGRMRMLFEKSGADGTFARFAFEMRQLAVANDLPEFALSSQTNARGEEVIHMRLKEPWKRWKDGVRLESDL
ncbi:replication initiator protein A [Methylobacterium sp. E-005]|uniref:replication initiator protein A n=1 Tax=Methylobacterium sp. E-005 TaxID=2836549 RepID=UPI001FB9086D|nr:replication initiator protein A [Methylobacterium sp. E-005]MCJ2086736.1 replication initiator protein A [Methylobacterium sp. E-005]